MSEEPKTYPKTREQWWELAEEILATKVLMDPTKCSLGEHSYETFRTVINASLSEAAQFPPWSKLHYQTKLAWDVSCLVACAEAVQREKRDFAYYKKHIWLLQMNP